jgi:tetratricopeptide (TPR) repeat protein/predicted Ser/Thr protein kinase
VEHGDERLDPHAVTLLPGGSESGSDAPTSPGQRGSAEAPVEASRLGRYTLRGVLGRGGMGTVYEALDDRIGRTVALKLLHAELGGRHAARLVREARALARLSHPSVVQVYEVGQDRGRWFIVMERVRGRTLRQWQDERRRSWRACLAAYRRAGAGLAAAHRAGLTHRDFKPGNCVIDDEGRVQVLDFGLAREHGDASVDASASEPVSTAREQLLVGSLTRTGEVLGTLGYMPLEQLHGRAADARSDQWSFCASLYEAIHGERPFAAEAAGSLTLELMRGEVRPAPKGIDVPRRLRRALVRGLAKDPAARWPSMDALLAELGAIEGARRTRWTATVAVGIAVGLGVAGALIETSPGPEPPLPATLESSEVAAEDGRPASADAVALRELAEAEWASSGAQALREELERIAPGQTLPEEPSLAAEVLLWRARLEDDLERSAALLRQAHLRAREADVPSVESRAAGAMAGSMQGAHAEGVAEWLRLAWVAVERTPWDRRAAIEVAVTAAHSAAVTWEVTGDRERARAMLEFADAVVGTVEPEDDAFVAMQLVRLAGGWSSVREPARALHWGLRARALLGAVAGPDHAQWARASEEIGRAIHPLGASGCCEEAIGYLDDAHDAYLRIGDGRSAATVGFEVVRCLRELGRSEQALTEIRRVGEHFATDEEIFVGQRQHAHLVAGEILVELGRPTEAIAEYERLLTLVDLDATGERFREAAKESLEALREPERPRRQ